MIPHRTPSALPWLYPSLTWRMEPHEKTLYLTFDDGPVTGPTEYALEQLSALSVPATFFCIGDNVLKYPTIFNKIIAHGHSVGNHTVNHLNGWRHSTATYLSNVKEFDGIAANAGFQGPTNLFRPPYGRITRRQIKALGGYQIVMWDVLSQDYERSLSPENCLRRTIRACRPGSIVVFHDSYKAEPNMEYALPRLIDHFGGKGYVFKALPII
jgi:Predicted xylanase/chitin deacetylase